MPFAHPLTEPFQLPVSPLVSAWLCTVVVLVAAFAWPHSGAGGGAVRAPASWAAVLSPGRLVARLVGVALLVLCIAAGRLGTTDELENLAPALIVGAAWPLLVLVSALAGPIWRWVDPWDTLARLSRAEAGDEPATAVWPAALVALPWAWYLSAYQDTLEPRSVGTMLALYTVFTVAGCLAVGRRRWLSSAEPFGLLLSWAALLPQRRLADWEPPRGAEALLGVLAGGILFGAVRRSELWGDLNVGEHAGTAAAAGVIGAALLGAALLMGIAAVARIESPLAGAAAARAAVPVVAAIIVAVALERNRLTTSAQLLPGLLGDPFGEGWDLFGRAGEGLEAEPFGVRGLLLVQLGVLVAGHVAGAIVAASRLDRHARVPVALGLGLLVNLSVLAIATH